MSSSVQAGPSLSESAQESRWWSWPQIYLLVVLLLVSASNYTDRQVVPLLQEMIKAELRLSDTQLGILSGIAFSLFYSLGGIPIARLAERHNRVRLLSFVITVWSVMTGLCGLVPNYPTFALCRLGVGLAEGGSIPISQSLIAEKFTRRQRGFAMAVFSTGGPLAHLIVPILGGMTAHYFGWRAAFFAVAIPGILLAILVLFTLKESRLTDGIPPEQTPSTFKVDMAWLIRSKPFVYLFIAAAFTGWGTVATTFFTVSFLTRAHNLSIVEVGAVFGLTGITGLIGTFVGGWLADRFAGPAGRSYPYVCGIGMALSFIVYLAAWRVENVTIAFACILIGSATANLKTGPSFAAVQNIVPTRMRATGAAIYMFAATLIGTGFGPFSVGWMSDFFAARLFTAGGEFQASCPGGRPLPGASAELIQACKFASTEGLRTSLSIVCVVFLLATIFYYITGRTMKPSEEE